MFGKPIWFTKLVYQKNINLNKSYNSKLFGKYENLKRKKDRCTPVLHNYFLSREVIITRIYLQYMFFKGTKSI